MLEVDDDDLVDEDDEVRFGAEGLAFWLAAGGAFDFGVAGEGFGMDVAVGTEVGAGIDFGGGLC